MRKEMESWMDKIPTQHKGEKKGCKFTKCLFGLIFIPAEGRKRRWLAPQASKHLKKDYTQ